MAWVFRDKEMYYDTIGYELSEHSIYDINMQSYDLLLTDSKFEEDVFKSAFKFEGTMIRTGHPRNDIFFADNSEINKKVRKKLKITNDKKSFCILRLSGQILEQIATILTIMQ